MSSGHMAKIGADTERVAVNKLVEELSLLNSLLRTIVADKARQDPPPPRTESPPERPQDPALLAETLKPDPKRIHYDYDDVKAFTEQLIPTGALVWEMFDVFLGVFGIDGIGASLAKALGGHLPLGSSTLQVHMEDGKLVDIPWTNLPKIRDQATRIKAIQRVEDLAHVLKDQWPHGFFQHERVEDDTDIIVRWNLNRCNCEIRRTGLTFNQSGYLQTTSFDVMDPMQVEPAIANGLDGFISGIDSHDPMHWEKLQFVKIWNFYGYKDSQIIPLSLIAWLLSALTLKTSYTDITGVYKPHLDHRHASEMLTALQNFSGTWLDSVQKFSVSSWYGYYNPFIHHNPAILLNIVFRHFSTECQDSKHPGSTFTGLRCNWEGGPLVSLADGGFKFMEKRTWFGITTARVGRDVAAREAGEARQEFPLSTVVCLSERPCDPFIEQISWQNFKLLPCMEGSGIAVFLLLICQYLSTTWDLEWNRCIDSIDSMVRVKIDDVRDTKKIIELMFDDSFEMSKNYFTILQLLRVFTDCIQESMDDLQQMQSEFLTNFPPNSLISDFLLTASTRQVLAANWQTTVSLQGAIGKRLLTRIEKKTEEVKSLRDGLFNATSLREASRGLVLNQYILVFTILTIFYLPLSFVATLFGMNLFDKDDPSQNRAAFFISTVLIASITYVISGLTLWRVSPEG